MVSLEPPKKISRSEQRSPSPDDEELEFQPEEIPTESDDSDFAAPAASNTEIPEKVPKKVPARKSRRKSGGQVSNTGGRHRYTSTTPLYEEMKPDLPCDDGIRQSILEDQYFHCFWKNCDYKSTFKNVLCHFREVHGSSYLSKLNL